MSNGQNIPIHFGARLTGNVTEKLRIGLLDVQTGGQDAIAPQNYGVIAVQQRILKRSSLSGIFVNRQNTDDGTDYNRVAGAEYSLVSENGFLTTRGMYYKSFSKGIQSGNDFASASIFLNARSYRLFFQADHVGDNYMTDVGFTPRLFNYDADNDVSVRLNYQQYNLFGAIDYRPQKGSIVFHGPRAQTVLYTNNGNLFNERYSYIGYEIDFANQSQFDAGIDNHTIKLLYPTGFLNDNEPLPAGRGAWTESVDRIRAVLQEAVPVNRPRHVDAAIPAEEQVTRHRISREAREWALGISANEENRPDPLLTGARVRFTRPVGLHVVVPKRGRLQANSRSRQLCTFSSVIRSFPFSRASKKEAASARILTPKGGG